MTDQLRFTSSVVSTDKQDELISNIQTMLVNVLHRRTYFNSVVNNTPIADPEYHTSDARMWFQCALACTELGQWAEALAWYVRGSLYYTGSAVICDDNCDIQLDWEDETKHWVVSVDGWKNTMYGSSRELIEVAHINCRPFFDMPVNDWLVQANFLRDVFLEHVEVTRKRNKQNDEALRELAEALRYDN